MAEALPDLATEAAIAMAEAAPEAAANIAASVAEANPDAATEIATEMAAVAANNENFSQDEALAMQTAIASQVASAAPEAAAEVAGAMVDAMVGVEGNASGADIAEAAAAMTANVAAAATQADPEQAADLEAQGLSSFTLQGRPHFYQILSVHCTQFLMLLQQKLLYHYNYLVMSL